MNSKSILVSGATGYVGGRLIPEAFQEGEHFGFSSTRHGKIPG